MDRILYTAMSGARQSMERQSVVSHNLANVTTAGFRAQLHELRAVPVQGDGALDTRVSVAATVPGSDFSSGPVNATGRDLDIAVRGDGWIAVQAADGVEAYTRRGDLQINENGVITTGGSPVIGDNGPIVAPLGASLSMGADGTVSAIGAGENPDALVQVGRIKLVNASEVDLLRGGDGLFRAPAGEGGEVNPLPRDEEAQVITGALEGSNVSAVESMVAMIDNGRRYEMQMKVIESADENARRADNLLSMS